jgi:hypothetical protein
VPSRMKREHPELPITHLVADRVAAH